MSSTQMMMLYRESDDEIIELRLVVNAGVYNLLSLQNYLSQIKLFKMLHLFLFVFLTGSSCLKHPDTL